MESRSEGAPSNEPVGHDEALAAVAEARRAAADRLITPWWYHPILGLMLGGFAVAYGLGGTAVRMLGLVVFFGGIWLLMTAYRRVTGLWVWGHQSGPASRWAYAMGAVGGLGMVSALAIGYTDVNRVWMWILAGAIVVSTTVIGHTYDRALRAHLRGES